MGTAAVGAFTLSVAQAINNPGITTDSISVDDVTSASASIRRLFVAESVHSLRYLTTSDGVVIAFTVATTNAVGFSSPQQAFLAMTSNLNSAVADGSFKSSLVTNAQVLGAPASLFASVVPAPITAFMPLYPTARPSVSPTQVLIAPTRPPLNGEHGGSTTEEATGQVVGVVVGIVVASVVVGVIALGIQQRRSQKGLHTKEKRSGRVLLTGPQLLGTSAENEKVLEPVDLDDVTLVEASPSSIIYGVLRAKPKRVVGRANRRKTHKTAGDFVDNQEDKDGVDNYTIAIHSSNPHSTEIVVLGDDGSDKNKSDDDDADDDEDEEEYLPQSPFKRFRPHLYRPELVSHQQPGRYLVSERSSIFKYMQYMCDSRGGSWNALQTPSAALNRQINPDSSIFGFASMFRTSSLAALSARTSMSCKSLRSKVAGFRLVGVEMIISHPHVSMAFESRHNKLNIASLSYVPRKGTGKANCKSRIPDGTLNNASSLRPVFNRQQSKVLDLLKRQYLSRGIQSSTRTSNSFYTFYGPSRELLAHICSTGTMVAVTAADEDVDAGSGYFGLGCYTTLNIEYALRMARGDFDAVDRRRSRPVDGRYPIIMLVATVNNVYPLTPNVDYGHKTAGITATQRGLPTGYSKFLGKPLKPGFDAHVICVNEHVGEREYTVNVDDVVDDQSHRTPERHACDGREKSKRKSRRPASCGMQAVNRDSCQYVEVVLAQEVQLLPLAVLWFLES
jgi:hypothetical protein